MTAPGKGRRPSAALPGAPARKTAIEALVRIESEGAYANIVLPALLERSDLDPRDRSFVTELVYGTTRMRRACDWLVDRYLLTDLDPVARTVLRLGAYQLVFLDTPPHAAVSATVDAAPKKLRGLTNAVLRRVADGPREWPDEATRLSYPDWIIDRFVADLGVGAGVAALEAMNVSATATDRGDGYMQDPASQWVADAVGATPDERVLDLCAAPGGKATRLAQTGAFVVAADVRPGRVGLIAQNIGRLELGDRLAAVAADGLRPPFPPGSFDRILVDAPCSGLGALRRRADARWRIEAADVPTLASLQVALVDAAVPLLKPGGTFVYSACTLTLAESVAIDDHLEARHPRLAADESDARLTAPWSALGRGWRVLPQDAGTDGMYVLRLRSVP